MSSTISAGNGLNAPAAASTATTQAWFTRCPVPTSFALALRRGLVEDEVARQPGYTLAALQSSGDAKVQQSHYTHTQPNSLRHGGNIPAIYAQASGADTRVIGLSTIRQPQTVLVSPDSGIRSVRDLLGRRLLVLRRAHEAIDFAYYTALRTYEVALNSVGFGLSDVEIVEVPVAGAYIDDRPRQKLSSQGAEPGVEGRGVSTWTHTVLPLIRGEVDAIASAGPTSVQLQAQLGLHAVFDQAQLAPALQANNSHPLPFTVNARFLDEHPGFIDRLLQRTLQAEREAQADPDGAIHQIALELGLSERVVRQAYGPHLLDNLAVGFDPQAISGLQAQIDFLARHGAIAKAFDVNSWLAPEALARARLGASQGNH